MKYRKIKNRREKKIENKKIIFFLFDAFRIKRV